MKALATMLAIAIVALSFHAQGGGEISPLRQEMLKRSGGNLGLTGSFVTWNEGGPSIHEMSGLGMLSIVEPLMNGDPSADLINPPRPRGIGFGADTEGCEILSVVNIYYEIQSAIILAQPLGHRLAENTCLPDQSDDTWVIHASNDPMPSFSLCATAQHWVFPPTATAEDSVCGSFSEEYLIVGQGVRYNMFFFGLQFDVFIATGPAQVSLGNFY